LKIRAVLFDLDGTLLDTIEDLTDSMNAVLLTLGFPGHSVSDCKTLVGEGVEHFARGALPAEASQDERLVARSIELMRSEYRARWHRKTRPYDGIPQLLDDLAGRGMKLAVLSNKADDFTRLMVAHYFPGIAFETVAGARPGRAKKPDPAPALEASLLLGVPPAETAFVGDTKTDMETAGRAGMIPIGALWGFRSAPELLENGARYLIRRPAELLWFID
jgi:phosphoglycolate phosphatase